MILIDTSVWIDHLSREDPDLVELLNNNQVATHPMVIGELGCGNLPNREEILRHLQQLQQVSVATDDEVLFFIEQHRLVGTGIGYIDAHLLAATMFDRTAQLWTRDRRLMSMATEMEIRFVPNG